MNNMVEFNTDSVSGTGYIAAPQSGNGPGILLMHAWWGLNDYFKGLADRLAAEGYVVLAPDLYAGETVSEIEDAKGMIGKLDSDQAIKQQEAALDYLLKHPQVQGGRVGAIGFSMGASYANWLSTLRPEVSAVVMFYGGGDSNEWLDLVNGTQAAFLGHFAEGDDWEPDEAVHGLEAQLQEAGRDATFHIYPGVGHWFMESNRPDVYNEAAAEMVWTRTLDFLRDKLAS